MRMSISCVLLLGLVVTTPSMAQHEFPKPGPEHAFLKEGEGTWDAIAKSQGKESKGLLEVKMVNNGLWMLEVYKGEAAGMPFEGRGATSYDPVSKKYVNVWIDSLMTRPMVSEGTYDKDKKVLTLRGDMPMPDGKAMKTTYTITYKDANTKVLSLKGAMDGKEFEMVEITYKRRTK